MLTPIEPVSTPVTRIQDHEHDQYPASGDTHLPMTTALSGGQSEPRSVSSRPGSSTTRTSISSIKPAVHSGSGLRRMPSVGQVCCQRDQISISIIIFTMLLSWEKVTSGSCWSSNIYVEGYRARYDSPIIVYCNILSNNHNIQFYTIINKMTFICHMWSGRGSPFYEHHFSMTLISEQ